MNRKWTGKLQVKLLFAYLSWKKLRSHTFKAPLEEVIGMSERKMKAKHMNENVWKSFFCKLGGLASRNFITN